MCEAVEKYVREEVLSEIKELKAEAKELKKTIISKDQEIARLREALEKQSQ